NTYTFSTPPVRPGQVMYLGFRAVSDSIFSVSATTNGLPAQEPATVAFYGGTATTNVPPFSAGLFRGPVPPEATRWKHASTHPTNLVAYIDQGSLPTRNANRWVSFGANSSYTTMLVNWNDTTKQHAQARWPSVTNQTYFLIVSTLSDTVQ